MTGSDLEVTSFDRKWPGSGCRRPKTRVLGAFQLLQGCNSQEVPVMWQKITSHGQKWPEETFHRKWPGKGSRRLTTLVLDVFELLQGCNSQEMPDTWQEITSHGWKWPELHRQWCHFSRSVLEKAIERRQLAFWRHLSSYSAVTRRRCQSRDRKWRHVAGSYLEGRSYQK